MKQIKRTRMTIQSPVSQDSQLRFHGEVQVTATASDGRVLKMSIGATEVAEQHWISLMLRSNSDNQTINQEIELLNQQTEPWIFAISAYSIQALLKDRSALLEQK